MNSVESILYILNFGQIVAMYMIICRPTVFFIWVPFKIILVYLDQIKDWMLIIRITISLGGPMAVQENLIHQQSFSSVVSTVY